ncbi:MAG TPA: hypothetical protein VKR58_08045, partial [Aquella sp.]|nr:hypothetical protein [Aquella sp.]
LNFIENKCEDIPLLEHMVSRLDISDVDFQLQMKLFINSVDTNHLKYILEIKGLHIGKCLIKYKQRGYFLSFDTFLQIMKHPNIKIDSKLLYILIEHELLLDMISIQLYIWDNYISLLTDIDTIIECACKSNNKKLLAKIFSNEKIRNKYL